VESPYELAGKILAKAVLDIGFRRALRDELQASPFSEHKIVLQRLVDPSKPAASALRAIDAGSLAALTDIVNSSGPIEVSIPGDEARRAWRPTETLDVVAYNGRNSQSVTRWSGSLLASTVPVQSLKPTPLLLVAPAEPMARRRQTVSAAGEAIQAAGESQVGISRLVQTPFGLREVFAIPANVASILTCEDDPAACEGGGGGGPPPATDTTFLLHLVVLDVVDNGMPWQTNEFEWRALYVVNGVSTDYSVLRITGIPKDLVAFYNEVLITRKPSSTANAQILVNVVETDAFGDDTFPPTITLNNSQNVFPPTEYRRGADKCWYAQTTFGFPCYPANNNPYRETNHQFRYN